MPIPRLSIIVPTLNEAEGIANLLVSLMPLRQRGHEVIVADGGSIDNTVELSCPLADVVIKAPRGRAAQMNAGVALASGDVLLFLHADTRLPPQADELILKHLTHPACGFTHLTLDPPHYDPAQAMRQDGLINPEPQKPDKSNEFASTLEAHFCQEYLWGRFDVTIEGKHPFLPVVAWLMNHRSRLTGIATGDQAMFVYREVFEAVGGFPNIALMEDIALSKKLKAISSPMCLKARVTTSGRRWEKHGILRTILKMWRLRLAYFFGVDPIRLAKAYGYEPHND